MDLIKIENFSFSYPEAKKSALSDININFEEGSFNIICGTSGCGKSTLLRQLKTVLTPNGNKKGEIYFKGKPLSQIDERNQSSKIGYVMQNPDNQIVTDKVWHELAFGLESLGFSTSSIRLRVAEMASYFGIQQWFYRNVTELSGGQKQLLNLASIMAMHPDVLILDEPTSQLDPIAASDFLETIKKINRDLGTTVIMTEHRLEDIFPYATKIIVIDNGKKLIEGNPREAGEELRRLKHKMFLALPAPMQIASYVESDEKSPLTVRDGRNYISDIVTRKNYSVKEDMIREYLDKKGDSGLKIFDENSETSKEKPVLEMKEVWFRYGREYPDVVKGLNLSINRGEIYCLLGGNGTGKSTTLSLLSRINVPYRGKIFINGKDIRKYRDKELFTSFLGVVPQNPQSLFVKKTVELELFEMLGGPKERLNDDYNLSLDKKEIIENIAKVTRIEGLLSQHPYDLSGGEQQRLALAKILLLRPKILLMDEPTKGLDSFFKDEFAGILQTLKKHGVTIFMISHDIEFCARYADRCGMFFDGNLVTQNNPTDFFSGNSFYTTTANRMARSFFPKAVTVKDVIKCLKKEM
ncbi:energy-coupling factor transport system ATP-binding protein [Acetitomaculum ruminis DSM 5522]|uniref:Energy-coupling factor transport system ATP-binding protein n=1 Tax=Acetitomaculum ruminis DSM 5522 TaxID=1120918 RepID=A0A1I0XU53_9FIRM|nr:ABC transporter ATP-binding protein [Acetitomaculum ruminis]SFB03790.1 energy-coupling factor transport system ATP-binding protein [Acetitomaculum ruminis DSM 5522]